MVDELKKVVFGLTVLLFMVVIGAMIADVLINDRPARKADPAQESPVDEPVVTEPGTSAPDVIEPEAKDPAPGPLKKIVPKTRKEIKFEIFDDVEPPESIPAPEIKPEEKPRVPVIAIIIDDIGYDRRMARAFCDIDPRITFSILPLAPHGREIAGYLHERGAQLMLHLPMEPEEFPEINPGPGAILADMPPDVLLFQLKQNLDDIPYISGVNNHMGSRITAMSEKMNQIFTILKKRDLFFVDSMTAHNSECRASARLLQLKFATRDVFLDNIQEPAYITGQFNELLEMARRRGMAIGIGHPYKATLETLQKELPKLEGRFEIVPVKNLTYIPG